MNHVIILAGGHGNRLKEKTPKALVKINNLPLFSYAAEAFRTHPKIESITILLPPGGKTRQKSLEKALKILEQDYHPQPRDIIIIHNAANPFVTNQEINAVIIAAKKYQAAAVAHPVTDTIKQINKNNRVEKTLERAHLVALQTPQAIRYDLLKQALTYATKSKIQVTDDLSLIEHLSEAKKLSIQAKILPASQRNRKITTPSDLEWARLQLHDFSQLKIPEIKTGLGEDSHAFDRHHRGLKLGGLLIKNQPKLKANSDGDVILHALCNAIAQTIGEKSLGSFADQLFKEKGEKDSAAYLIHILNQAQTLGYRLKNIGISIEAQHPKIDPIANSIKAQLSLLTGLATEQIGLTAHTGENLSPFGQGKGIKATAIVTMAQQHADTSTP